MGVWSHATAVGSTAIANGAEAFSTGATVIGRASRGFGENVTIVGRNSFHGSLNGTVVGSSSQYFGAIGDNSTIIGSNINASAATSFNNSTMLGANFNLPAASNNDLTAIGTGLSIVGDCSNSIIMGLIASITTSNDAVGIGRQVIIDNAAGGTAIGPNTTVSAPGASAIGLQAIASAQNAIALGKSVVANRIDTATVTKLEIQEVGAGIIMYSPDGTAYQLTVANGGTLSVVVV
jgi:hypothetical protein